jgi:hypothetical protein
MELNNTIIAVDFDDTLCFSNWPSLGAPNLPLINYLQKQKSAGSKIILWTCRAGKPLEDAIEWCKHYGLFFDAINDNPNQPSNAIGGKPIADVYVDDRAIQFDGDWAGAYQKITGFKAWEEGPMQPIEPPLDYCGQLLIEDFSQCMEMHRHYDSMNWHITKFAFGEILVAIGACWTVFNLDMAKDTIPDLKMDSNAVNLRCKFNLWLNGYLYNSQKPSLFCSHS